MYICLDCDCTFEEPQHWEERHGLDTPPYEHMTGCRYCGGSYTEAYKCDYCGDWITGDYIKIDDERYCDNCYTLHTLGDE